MRCCDERLRVVRAGGVFTAFARLCPIYMLILRDPTYLVC